MAKFLSFPEKPEDIGRVLRSLPHFNDYPWINYPGSPGEWHLNFNGEDISFSIVWYEKRFFTDPEPRVRLQVGHSQKKNPVPRVKGQRRSAHKFWVPARHFDRYFPWDKVSETLPKVLLTTFNKADRERLNAAYAEVAAVFPPAVEHHELHGDVSPYDESRLHESEEINDARWRELCRWAEEEWVGGASVSYSREDVKFYAATGANWLKFKSYKHGEEPRTLYQIVLGQASSDFIYTLIEGRPTPETLEEFFLVYAKYAEELANLRSMGEKDRLLFLRNLRKRFKYVQEDSGYASLAELYEYVMSEIRRPVAHEELHTDIGAYDEGLNYAGSSLNEAPMKKSKKSEEKLLRTLALFLRFVKAFKPDFGHWANLEEVWITADNPIWKTGGGGILKVASDVNKYFPLTVRTEYGRDLPLSLPQSRYDRSITRHVDIKPLAADPSYLYSREARSWKGPAFTVQIDYERYELTRTLRFRFQDAYAVPSVESLAGVHSFKTISPAQLRDVEFFTRAAEEMRLFNPVGRAAAIRQGTMGYADSKPEYQLSLLRNPEFKAKVDEAGKDFGSVFYAEHEELHTDIGGYDESVLSEALNLSATQLEAAMQKWSSLPDSEAKKHSADYYLFTRNFAEIGETLYFGIVLGTSSYIRFSLFIAETFPDFDAIPDSLGDLVIKGLENSEARDRLKSVKPATAAHWQKQFLLGINLEKKVPEEAFPAAPVATLPAYFDKFRSAPASSAAESDVSLTIATDLSLLGE